MMIMKKWSRNDTAFMLILGLGLMCGLVIGAVATNMADTYQYSHTLSSYGWPGVCCPSCPDSNSIYYDFQHDLCTVTFGDGGMFTQSADIFRKFNNMSG